MKRLSVWLLMVGLLLGAGSAMATTVTVVANIPGGWYNDSSPYWYLNYTTPAGPPGPNLLSAYFVLPSGLYFDTVGLNSQAYTSISGAATVGLTPPPPPVADNSTSMTINFSDFNPGEFYSWVIDVDGSGCSIGAICDDTNLVGTMLYLTFGGNGYATTVLSGVFSAPSGIGNNARVTITGEVVPEPATYALVGLGLAAFALIRKRARKV